MIDDDTELRYVVWIEVQAAVDPMAADDENDSLMNLEEMLERLEADDEPVAQDAYRRQRYDLCAECLRHFVQNPVGQDEKLAVHFSKN
jgi:hypothetical protein